MSFSGPAIVAIVQSASARTTVPAHSEVLDLVRGEHEDASQWLSSLLSDGHQVVLVEDPDRLELSPFEIEKLTAVSDAHRTVDTWTLVETSRELPEWKASRTSQAIPAEQILAAVGIPFEDARAICAEAESHLKLRQALQPADSGLPVESL